MGCGLDLSPLVFWGWMRGRGMLSAMPVTAAVKSAMDEYRPTPVVAMIREE